MDLTTFLWTICGVALIVAVIAAVITRSRPPEPTVYKAVSLDKSHPLAHPGDEATWLVTFIMPDNSTRETYARCFLDYRFYDLATGRRYTHAEQRPMERVFSDWVIAKLDREAAERDIARREAETHARESAREILHNAPPVNG